VCVCTEVWRATSGRRTPRRAADGRTGGHPGGRRTGGATLRMDIHTCLRYGEREDTEGAPTRRQGRCINRTGIVISISELGAPALVRNPNMCVQVKHRCFTVKIKHRYFPCGAHKAFETDPEGGGGFWYMIAPEREGGARKIQ
jgi:hypothetical protein